MGCSHQDLNLLPVTWVPAIAQPLAADLVPWHFLHYQPYILHIANLPSWQASNNLQAESWKRWQHATGNIHHSSSHASLLFTSEGEIQCHQHACCSLGKSFCRVCNLVGGWTVSTAFLVVLLLQQIGTLGMQRRGLSNFHQHENFAPWDLFLFTGCHLNKAGHPSRDHFYCTTKPTLGLCRAVNMIQKEPTALFT